MPRTLADQIEESLSEADEPEPVARPPVKPASGSRGLFRRKRPPIPFTAQATPAKRDRRSDFMVAALGVTLGLICALFPWYIFFNPDEFGVRAIKLLGNGEVTLTGPITLMPQPERVGAPSSSQEILPVDLDLLSTGTAKKEDDKEEHGTPDLSEQPFPAPAPVTFKLVHAANGRAMMEDDSGLFIVQRGSVLPDSSSVISIEERDGRWVLITSTDRTLEVEQ
jgi:hypothetical protein